MPDARSPQHPQRHIEGPPPSSLTLSEAQMAAHEESLQKLKAWIDNPPPFKQRPNSIPPFIRKSEFTFSILTEALIYAVGKYKILAGDTRKLEGMLRHQYNQTLDGWAQRYGLENPVNICLREAIDSPFWEEEIRYAYLTREDQELVPRTIAAVAYTLQSLKPLNQDLRRKVGELQGDVQPSDRAPS